MLKSANVRLEDYDHLPCLVILKDAKGKYLYSNNYLFELGINIKSSDFLGLNDFDFYTEKCASYYQTTDQRIYLSQISEKIHESIELKLGPCYESKTYKQPLYNSSNKIIGVLGFCYFTLMNNRTTIKQLSEREIMCVKQMAHGKTAKEIARCLDISHKTVEFHMANIKSKLNCYKRSEIIEKIISNNNILL